MNRGMEYIYEVYRERSFSRAARNLFISQPSLSADIKKMERMLGMEIFDRSTTPIGLTEFGRAYIKALEQMKEIEENLENYKNDLGELKTGSISIGGTTFFTSFVLPPMIRAFSEKYPAVTIHLMETNTAELEKYLYEGTVDLVIDNYRFDPELYQGEFLKKEEVVLAVPAHFASNEKAEAFQLSADDIRAEKHLNGETEAVPLEYFSTEPFLLLKEGNDTRRRADLICHHSYFTPHVSLYLDQQITAYNLTCQGMGISFLSDTLVKSMKTDREVVFYKLKDEDSSRSVWLYYKKTRYQKKAVKEFLKMVESFR